MARKVAEVTAPEGGGGGDGLGPRWQLWRRRRFVLASLAFWGLVSMYTTRINFSVAIVAMTSGSGACHRAALPDNASASAPVSANASAHAVSSPLAKCITLSRYKVSGDDDKYLSRPVVYE